MRPLTGAVPMIELRDRLDRARAALRALKHAPKSKAAEELARDLTREVQLLERDLARGP